MDDSTMIAGLVSSPSSVPPSTNRGVSNFAAAEILTHSPSLPPQLVGLWTASVSSDGSQPNADGSYSLPDVVVPHANPVLHRCIYRAFDKLELSFSLSWDEWQTLDRLCEVIYDQENRVGLLGDLEVSVSRSGARAKWRLDTGLGLVVCLPPHPNFPAMVYAGPKWLVGLASSAEAQYDTVGFAALALGVAPDRIASQVTRLDVCADFVMSRAELDDFTLAIAGRFPQVVSRARTRDVYLNEHGYTGFRLGKTGQVLRCYDKKLEAEETGDWSFWSEIYGPDLQLGEDETIVRVEFQMRGQFLRSWVCPLFPDGVRTVDQYIQAHDSLMLYLTQAWFRLAEAPQGKIHSRVTTAWWQGISDTFVAGDWSFLPGLTRLRRHVSGNIEHLLDMASGCLATVSAVAGLRHHDDQVAPAPLSLEDTIIVLQEYLEFKTSQQGCPGFTERARNRAHQLTWGVKPKSLSRVAVRPSEALSTADRDWRAYLRTRRAPDGPRRMVPSSPAAVAPEVYRVHNAIETNGFVEYYS